MELARILYRVLVDYRNSTGTFSGTTRRAPIFGADVTSITG